MLVPCALLLSWILPEASGSCMIMFIAVAVWHNLLSAVDLCPTVLHFMAACVKRQQRSKHLPQAFTRREDSSCSVRRTRTCCASVRLVGPATVSCRHCVRCFLSSKTSEELEFAFSSRGSKACSTCVSFRFFAVFVVLERQGGCRKTGLLLRPLSLPSAMRQRSWPRSVGDKGNLSDLDGSGTAVASGMLLGDTFQLEQWFVVVGCLVPMAFEELVVSFWSKAKTLPQAAFCWVEIY